MAMTKKRRASAKTTRPHKKTIAAKPAVRRAAINIAMLPEYLTPKEVAKIIRRHPTTVVRIFTGRKGVIRPKRGDHQRSMLISKEAIGDYLSEAGYDFGEAAGAGAA